MKCKVNQETTPWRCSSNNGTRVRPLKPIFTWPELNIINYVALYKWSNIETTWQRFNEDRRPTRWKASSTFWPHWQSKSLIPANYHNHKRWGPVRYVPRLLHDEPKGSYCRIEVDSRDAAMLLLNRLWRRYIGEEMKCHINPQTGT